MAVSSKSIKGLSPRHQQLFEQARAAYNAGNPQAAVGTLSGIVREEPGCAAVRKALRAAQFDAVPPRRAGVAGMCRAAVDAALIRTKGKPLVDAGEHEKALAFAEDILAGNPRSRQGLLFLAETARSAKLPEVAEDAVECAVKVYPEDPRCWRALADVSLKYGNGRRALAALRKLRNFYPDDVELKAEINQAKAAAVMDMESWEKVATARDPAPPEAIPESAEDASFEDIEEAQDRAHRQTSEEPKAATPGDAAQAPHTAVRRRLKAQMLAKQRRQKAASSSVIGDMPAENMPLSAREFQDEMDSLAGAMEQWRIYGRTHPDKHQEADSEIEGLQQKRHRLMRSHYEMLAKQKPDDAEVRFELGKLLLEDADWDYAIEQFQHARRDPALTGESLANIGRCMAGKGLTDLAQNQFEAALEADFGENEPARLAAMYDLADLYEASDRQDDAAALLKAVYATDITFRNVSFRVEKLYAAAADAGSEDDSE